MSIPRPGLPVNWWEPGFFSLVTRWTVKGWPASMEATPAKGSFELAGLRGNTAVEVLGEDRTIAGSDGRFADEFEPYAVHLYRVRSK